MGSYTPQNGGRQAHIIRDWHRLLGAKIHPGMVLYQAWRRERRRSSRTWAGSPRRSRRFPGWSCKDFQTSLTVLLSKATPQAHVSTVLPDLGAAARTHTPPREPAPPTNAIPKQGTERSRQGSNSLPGDNPTGCERTRASEKFLDALPGGRSARNALHILHSIHPSLCEALSFRPGLQDVKPPELCAAPETG